MTELLRSGTIVDFALGVIAIELLVILLFRLRTGRGLSPVDVVGHLSSGALLLVAVRCAVVGADLRWTFAALGLSFPAHLFDLVRRSRAVSAGP